MWLSGYSYRAPISVDFSGKVGSGTSDVTVSVPKWDHFWDNIQADGDDIRIMDSDGVTALDYEWNGFNYANKTGTIEIDDVPYTQPCQKLVWLYYGNATATDGSTSITPSTPSTGVIHLLKPALPVFSAQPERAGGQVPLQEVALTKTDSAKVVSIDMAPRLRPRCTDQNGRTIGEEIKEVTAGVNDTDDSSVASVVDDANTRFVPCEQGRGSIVDITLDGSAAGISDGSDYVLTVSLLTSEAQTLDIRIGIRCVDVRPRA